jgi:hypothetical protein
LQALSLLAACVERWQSQWNPGPYLVVDESMVKWSGEGDMQIMKIPRKPTSCGF